ncbi:spermine/spermidine synthase domain-containing protein [Methyloligella solikamskensis]|uniref:Spermidine synthase n=1 Tax=Methyloligella solikamskensis TaxID=1177756 RepID=A0ABW3JB93_9HYPH
MGSFTELDYRPTPMGALSLRRRRHPSADVDIYEIKLGDEFLMSSQFTASEIALARLGLSELAGDGLDVVVGGLGLGYTAEAVLEDDRVGSLLVVEFMEAVIEWHEEGLLPLGPALSADPRARMVCGDFFGLAANADGFDPKEPGRRFDAILLDIDHAPDAHLAPAHAQFYTAEGFEGLKRHLKPGGVFGLWSNAPPAEDFVQHLASVFCRARAEPVTFHNPLQDRDFTQTVYLARASEA